MKRAYVRPTMVGERFVANEYVAACGDSGTVYKFKCNAGGGVSGTVYVESNNQPGLQPYPKWLGGDECLGSYHACGTTHEADTDDDFQRGYYVPYGGKAQDVIVWTAGGTNVHCTDNLDQNKWETSKS